MPDLTDQSLPHLEGIVNLRDVGGLPLHGGGQVRPGVLFRSESLQGASEEDAQTLISLLGIGSILDLRSAAESIREGRGPLDASAATYVNVPLNPAALDLTRDPLRPSGHLTSQVYRGFARDPGGSLPRVFALLPELLHEPTLVHCAAGKDRTGLVVAMILEIAGVPRDAVVEDYLRSALANDRVNEMLALSPHYRAHMQKADPEFYEVHEFAIRDYLEWLDSEYGGAASWALERGLTTRHLDRITELLT